MAPDGRVFVTGPDVVRSVTGEHVDMEALGGPAAHGRKSGVVHIVADSEADALAAGPHRSPALLPARASPASPGCPTTPTWRACCPSRPTAPTTSTR